MTATSIVSILESKATPMLYSSYLCRMPCLFWPKLKVIPASHKLCKLKTTSRHLFCKKTQQIESQLVKIYILRNNQMQQIVCIVFDI